MDLFAYCFALILYSNYVRNVSECFNFVAIHSVEHAYMKTIGRQERKATIIYPPVDLVDEFLLQTRISTDSSVTLSFCFKSAVLDARPLFISFLWDDSSLIYW